MACKYTYKGVTYNSKEEFINQVVNPQILGKSNTESASDIYSKLGNKTREGNVVIQSVYQTAGVQYAKSIGGVFSLRVNGTNNQFGNPFSSVESEIQKGLIRTKSTQESVEKYIEWVLSPTTNIKPEQHKFIRKWLQSGKLKGKPVVYYKELGEPSHATALDYLINKYDWSKQENKTLTKTRRILEVQSDLFQKGRDENLLAYSKQYAESASAAGMKVTHTDMPNENKFLQLLNKDNNWVTFFVKSIIQDSAKKGYEKVLFPSGNTASKVEGHTTLEEFKKYKENRIKELNEEKEKLINQKLKTVLDIEKDTGINNVDRDFRIIRKRDNKYQDFQHDLGFNEGRDSISREISKQEAVNIVNDFYAKELEDSIKRTDNEINQLKQELERVESPEGFGALKPIWNFYENTVTNILNKAYGKENVKVVTDEYGNTWNEILIDQNRDQQDILFNRELVDEIDRKDSEDILRQLAGKFEDRIGVKVNFISAEQAKTLTEGNKTPWNGERAFYYNDEVYFIEGAFKKEDILHEFAHPIFSAIRKNNPTVFNKLYEELLSTEEGREIIERVKEDYPEYSTGQRQEEAMVKFTERAAMNQLETEKSLNLLQKILLHIKQALRKIFKSKIKVEKLNENTSLNDLAKMLVSSEFSLPEAISEKDLIQYTRNVKEQKEALEALDNADTQSLINLLYDFSSKQYSKMQKNKYLIGVKQLNEKGESLGGVTTVRQRMALLQDIKTNLSRESGTLNKTEEIIKTMIELNILSKNISKHVEELLSSKIEEQDFKVLFYYAEMIKEWENAIGGLEEIFNKRNEGKINVPLDHPLRQNLNNIFGDLKSIRNSINSTRKVLTVDFIYNSLSDLIKTQEDYFKKELEGAKNDKQRAEINKRAQSQKITRESIEKLLTGEASDVNYLSAMLEQWNMNPDLVIGSFGKLIKDAQTKTRGQELKRHSKFASEFQKIIKETGLNPKDIQEFAKNFLFLDTVSVLEYKDEDGNPLTEPRLVEKKVWTFLNSYKDYRSHQRKIEHELEQIKDEALKIGDKTEYYAKLREIKEHNKDFFYREYADEFYEPMETLLSTDEGNEAYNEMISILNKKQDLQTLLDRSEGLKDFEEFEKELDDAQKEYVLLFSKTDQNGNLKEPKELKKTELLLEYREKSKKFRESKVNKKAFDRSYRDEMDRLIGTGLKPNTKQFDDELKKWLDKNTFSKIKAEYYEEKMKLITQLKDIDKNSGSTLSPKIEEKYNKIFELSAPFKDKNRVIEASAMPENVLKEINQLEKEIIELQSESFQETGLNEEESLEFQDLESRKSKLTPEEKDKFRELLSKQGSKKKLDPNDLANKKKILSKLAELSEKEVTEYYITILDSKLNSVNSQGLAIPVIDKNSIDEVLANKTLLEELFKRSPEFEKWFKENHNLKNKWDEETKSKYTVWSPSYAWTLSKPKDNSWYEKTEIFDINGELRYINAVPSYKYTFSVVKKEYHTGYDPATGKVNLSEYTDINGNFLPKSLADGARDSRYINQDYETLKSTKPEVFKLLKLMTDYHLESQQMSEDGEYVDYAFKLGFDLPRYRQTKYEVATGQSLSTTLGDKWRTSPLSQALSNIKASLFKASDDFEEGYNFRLENQLIPVKIVGNMDEIIPINGTSKLSQELVSMDIIRSIMDYGISTALHKNYKHIKPELKSILDVLEDDSLGQVGSYTKQGLLKSFNKKDSKVNRLTTVKGLYDRHLLGKTLKKDNEDINTLLKWMNKASAISGFAYLSDLPAGIKNAWAQTYQSIIESVGGDLYNFRDLMIGKKLAYKTSLFISKDIYDAGPKELLVQIADKYGIIQERFESKSSQSFARSAKKDIFDAQLIMAPRQWFGHQATMGAGFAFLNAVKVEQTIDGVTKSIPLHEAYELDENGILKLKEGIDSQWEDGKKFSDTVIEVNTLLNRLEGSFASMDQAEADRWITFKWIMHMKKWFLPMFINKFSYSTKGGGLQLLAPFVGKAEARYFSGSNEMRMGYYVSTINSIAKELRFLITTGQFYNMSKPEKTAILKTIVEIAMIKVIFSEILLGLVLGYDPEDDERLSKMKEKSSYLQIPFITKETDQEFNPIGFMQNNLVNILIGTRNEADFFIPLPGFGGKESIENMTSLNSIASKPFLERSLSLPSALFDYLTDNNEGFYKRDTPQAFVWRQEGQSKELNAFLKSIGVTGEFIDPADRRRSMERYDSRSDLGLLKKLGLVEDPDDKKRGR